MKMQSFPERFWVAQAREAGLRMGDRWYQPHRDVNSDHAPNELGSSSGPFAMNPV